MVSIADQVKGMIACGAGPHPMRRDDYRQPMREAMLRDARAFALEAADAPPHIRLAWSPRPLSEWPNRVRSNCFPERIKPS